MKISLLLQEYGPVSRKFIGWLIILLGTGYGLLQLYLLMQQQDHVRYAFYAGMIAASATALGTLPALFTPQLTRRWHDGLLGFGAGVMLAACMFSLILPALNILETDGVSGQNRAVIVAIAIMIGAGLMFSLERLVPHEHFIKGTEGQQRTIKRRWLFVFAIALHNIPEGLAIGAGYAGSEFVSADALAMGIAIQDIPEGLVISMALLGIGYSRTLAIGVGMLSGLTEPVMAIIGATVLGESAILLPWGLALAAGAMLFVISHEMIPESHRQGHELAATNGLMLGFVLMMLLDTALK